MIALALVTGIAPQQWADLGSRGIATALELIDIKNGRRQEAERFESPAETQEDTGKPMRYSG